MFEAVSQKVTIMLAVREKNRNPVFVIYEQNPRKVPFRTLPQEEKTAIESWISKTDYQDLDLDEAYIDTIHSPKKYVRVKHGLNVLVLGISYNHEHIDFVFRANELNDKIGMPLRNTLYSQLFIYWGLHTLSLPIYIAGEMISDTQSLAFKDALTDSLFITELIPKGKLLKYRSTTDDQLAESVAQYVCKTSPIFLIAKADIFAYIRSRIIIIKFEDDYHIFCNSAAMVEALQRIISKP